MDISQLSSPAVTKSSPKTKSYDPINHSPIQYGYSAGRYERMASQESPGRSSANQRYVASESPFRSAMSPGSSPYRESRGIARVGYMTLEPPVLSSPIFAKTRPRNELTNPITGAVFRYDIKRSNFRGLDTSFKSHLATSYEPVEVPYSSFKPLSSVSTQAQVGGRIAGALKRSPDLMTYVNPYSLDTSY